MSYNDFAEDSVEPEPAPGGLGHLAGHLGALDRDSGGGGVDGYLGGPLGGADAAALPEPIE